VNSGLTDAFTREDLLARYGTADPGLSIASVGDALRVAPNAEAIWAYLLWAIGLLVLLLAVLLSILMYVEADVMDRWPYDRVRTMGVLLAVAAVLYSGATVMLYLQFPGIYLPIGPFLYLAFGYVLLTVERT
jgi:uncharacterized protein (TIGR04206 family)